MLGIPVKLSVTPGLVEGPPPYFGEHNESVLSALGYSAEAVTALARDDVIASER